MKVLFLLGSIFLMSLSFAHDEGHGPALKDESRYGGKISAIINAGEVSKGRKATLLYKGELVHTSRGQEVKLYLFDASMKPLKLDGFEKKVKAVQIERNKEKEFELTLDSTGKFYKGTRPKNKRVPFNIDVRVNSGSQKLFGAFDGLD